MRLSFIYYHFVYYHFIYKRYFGGDTIHGVVEMDLKHPIETRGVRFIFAGFEYSRPLPPLPLLSYALLFVIPTSPQHTGQKRARRDTSPRYTRRSECFLTTGLYSSPLSPHPFFSSPPSPSSLPLFFSQLTLMSGLTSTALCKVPGKTAKLTSSNLECILSPSLSLPYILSPISSISPSLLSFPLPLPL